MNTFDAVALALAVMFALWALSLRRRLRQAVNTGVLAGHRASIEARRAQEFFNIIAGIEKERDTWVKLYQESSAQAGVAQNWLFRDLSGAVRRANAFAQELRKLGKPAKEVRIDPSLTEVLAEFGERHPEGASTDVQHAPGFEAAKEFDAEHPSTTIPNLAE